ncbi:MAG: cob(I)yrinic acid a,c-diamide adenosyltransferase [Prevotellaceae bacterium]|jgi:cob(I)alamin adenosyltransferase|nr:cob(I)yrinic acid a,c-diamide adenosyltransferase [Prevotellaceae bacterium]
MKIYTKKGDRGETSLIGGKRVPKNHIRVEAYGTVDELVSSLGIVKTLEPDVYYRDFILSVQNKLLDAGSILAAEGTVAKKLPEVTQSDVNILENEIDRINDALPALDCFIIPGVNQLEASIHLSRCICRRSERNIVSLTENNIQIPEILLEYFNRLSDFLFVYARKKGREQNSQDILWNKNE